MDQQKGWLINLFDICQPITDVYCGQLTNESAQLLQHLIYEPSFVNFHGLKWVNKCLKVLLVAGGVAGGDSTETLTMGERSWQTAGHLPYDLQGVRGVSINNKVLVTGEFSI